MSVSVNSPDVNRTLFEEGALLAILDFPIGAEIGIDYNSWRSAQNFRGIKMIPPGCHFVYYSAVSTDDISAPRTGFFHCFRPRELLAYTWNPFHEELVPAPDQVERLTQERRELDRFCGAYPYDTYKTWVSLTKHLDWSVVEHIASESGKVSSVSSFSSPSSTTESRRKMREKQEKGAASPADVASNLSSGLRFLSIPAPSVRRRLGASGRQITMDNMDMSGLLDELVATAGSPHALLGHLQFAFVTFLIGHVYDAFETWKQMVHLICNCDRATRDRPDFYMDFIGVLHFQVKEIPPDFFVDIVSNDNFLVKTLSNLFQITLPSSLAYEQAPAVDQRLADRLEKFRRNLKKKFKWDFSTIPDDELPQQVLLDADGAQIN